MSLTSHRVSHVKICEAVFEIIRNKQTNELGKLKKKCNYVTIVLIYFIKNPQF